MEQHSWEYCKRYMKEWGEVGIVHGPVRQHVSTKTNKETVEWFKYDATLCLDTICMKPIAHESLPPNQFLISHKPQFGIISETSNCGMFLNKT